MARSRGGTARGLLQVFRSPAGMTIIVKENHSTPIVSMSTYLRGGVRAEQPETNGISAFSQRLIMKGTESRSAEDVASELEFLGATMSPFTGKDVCGAGLSCLSRHFPRALEIFADCHLRPAFPADAVERERRIILSDLEKKKDDTLAYCLELCEGRLYREHPYRLPVAGTEETVRSFSAEQLAGWQRRICSPERMVVALVGDVQAGQARDLIIQAFSSLGLRGGVFPEVPAEGPLDEIRETSVRREKRQVAVALGFRAPSFGSPDFPAFDVLEHILSGMGSRLFIELRDKQGLAYVVSCSYDARLDGGVFRVYVGTSEERRERSRVAMLQELERLRQRRVTREELARTRRYMLGLHEIALQRNGAQAARLAFYEIMGAGHGFLQAYPRLIRAVTADDVQRVAQRYLTPDRYAMAQVL